MGVGISVPDILPSEKKGWSHAMDGWPAHLGWDVEWSVYTVFRLQAADCRLAVLHTVIYAYVPLYEQKGPAADCSHLPE